MLGRLGLSEQVVGVGDFVHWPPELTSKPRVGAYDAPNAEVILSLDADLLITTRSQAARSGLRRLEELGVEVLELDTESFDEIVEAYRILGARLHKEAEAAALVAELQRRQALVRERVVGVPKRRVLVVVGRDPLFVAGPGSHLDRMIQDAGGTNVAADVGAAYRQMSREAMLERSPEVIVDTSDNRPGAPRGREVGTWAQWDFLPAVEQERVYHVHPDRLVIPGPRLPEMTELMAKLIHPELFGEATLPEFGPLDPAVHLGPIDEEAGP